jgi:hypothetical protein
MLFLRKRSSASRCACTVATMLAFAWCFVFPHVALAENVTVPAQTSVELTTTAAIDPVMVNIGDQITLQAANDVVVNGKVVIQAGAPATARVTQAKKNNYIGIPASIGIVVEHVQAVDGNMIAISGAQVQEGDNKMVVSIGLSLICCLLFALMKGGTATIPSGTRIIANTTVRTDVMV